MVFLLFHNDKILRISGAVLLTSLSIKRFGPPWDKFIRRQREHRDGPIVSYFFRGVRVVLFVTAVRMASRGINRDSRQEQDCAGPVWRQQKCESGFSRSH